MKALVKSKKALKGTIQAEIKEAACYLEAAITTLSERISAKDIGEEEGSAEQLRKQVRSLKAENNKLHVEMTRIRVQMKGLIAGKKETSLRENPATADLEITRPENREREKQFPLNHTGNFMEVETAEKSEISLPPPPIRPPIKEVTKILGNYPPQIKSEEDRRAYDEITARIHELLNNREELIRGCQTFDINTRAEVKNSSPPAQRRVEQSDNQTATPDHEALPESPLSLLEAARRTKRTKKE